MSKSQDSAIDVELSVIDKGDIIKCAEVVLASSKAAVCENAKAHEAPGSDDTRVWQAIQEIAADKLRSSGAGIRSLQEGSTSPLPPPANQSNRRPIHNAKLATETTDTIVYNPPPGPPPHLQRKIRSDANPEVGEGVGGAPAKWIRTSNETVPLTANVVYAPPPGPPPQLVQAGLVRPPYLIPTVPLEGYEPPPGPPPGHSPMVFPDESFPQFEPPPYPPPHLRALSATASTHNPTVGPPPRQVPQQEYSRVTHKLPAARRSESKPTRVVPLDKLESPSSIDRKATDECEAIERSQIKPSNTPTSKVSESEQTTVLATGIKSTTPWNTPPPTPAPTPTPIILQSGCSSPRRYRAQIEFDNLHGDGELSPNQVLRIVSRAADGAWEVESQKSPVDKTGLEVPKSYLNDNQEPERLDGSRQLSFISKPPLAPPPASLIEALSTRDITTDRNTFRGGYSSLAYDWTGYLWKKEKDFLGRGASGSVYKASWRHPEIRELNPAIFVVKVMHEFRVQMQNKKIYDTMLKYLEREVTVWRNLDHENILPFVGIAKDFGELPSLVSFWMIHGTVRQYLEKKPEACRLTLMRGVARGLNYLHSYDQQVIHGDLKMDNVLVDHKCNPRVGDFGLSKILDDQTLWITSNKDNAKGTVRWMAPELILGPDSESTTASDVYAYAMTSLEILTGRVPFPDIKKEVNVIAAVGFQNAKPQLPHEHHVPEKLWTLWDNCWERDSCQRPIMGDVVKEMENICVDECATQTF